MKDGAESFDELNKLLKSSFQQGYYSGAVAVAEGMVIVEKKGIGKYYLRGEQDASTSTTTEC